MNTQELLAQSKRLLGRVQQGIHQAPTYLRDGVPVRGLKAQVSDFLRTYAGPKSAFYLEAKEVNGLDEYQAQQLASVLTAFIDHLENGLLSDISPERRAQLDVVSDFLEQSETLLTTRGFHPAAAAVVIGATLEEFLRGWMESVPLSLGNRKSSLQAYADVLRDAELLTKQDVKDIVSWAGIRNHAAHGEWEEVSDPARVPLMLEGVNLFMRKYTP
jgi:hypothetical protein